MQLETPLRECDGDLSHGHRSRRHRGRAKVSELVRRRRMDGNTSSIRQEHCGDAWRAAVRANRGFVRPGAKGNVLHAPTSNDTILLRAGLHVVARDEAG